MESLNKHQIDFTHLPLQEIAFLLRRLGKALITQLLETPSTHHTNTNSRPPDLLNFILKDEGYRLTRTRVWKSSKRRRSLRKLVRRAVHGKLNAKQWELAVNQHITFHIGGSKGNGLPDALWRMAGLLAWQDPLFKLWVHQKIYAELRQTHLLSPLQTLFITLSPNTFWVLINLMNLKPGYFVRFFSSPKRARVRLARALKEEGMMQIQGDEWAGFWDQWVIQRASLCWPAGFAQMDRYICKSLLELPLLNTPLDSPLYSGRYKKMSLWQPKQAVIHSGYDEIFIQE